MLRFRRILFLLPRVGNQSVKTGGHHVHSCNQPLWGTLSPPQGWVFFSATSLAWVTSLSFTNRFLSLSFYILIIVDFIKKVVASQATIPPPPAAAPRPIYIVIFCQSVCTDFEKRCARQSLCGFWKSCIFSAHKISRRVIAIITRLAILFLTNCH